MKVNGYEVPDNLYYNKEHEWIRIEDDTRVKMGITDYAQRMLKELSFVYLPENETAVNRQETIATIESVKVRCEIYSPLTGTIVEVNTQLNTKPRIINEDPYGAGWIVALQPSRLKTELKKLISAKKYCRFVKKLIKVDTNLLIYKWQQQKFSPR